MRRRNFLAALFAGAGAAKLLAKTPEPELPAPEQAVRLESFEGAAVYALEYPGYLTEEAVANILREWAAAFGPDAPGLIFLQGGMKLKAGPVEQEYLFAAEETGKLPEDQIGTVIVKVLRDRVRTGEGLTDFRYLPHRL